MSKLQALLATPPDSFVKDADIESPDEVQLEQDFASMAFVFLRDRAQALMPYLLGFEVVDREEDGSKAVGIFGFKIADKYFYVPAFFVNNQVKGMDLLYSKSTNSFMPLRETWINHILNKSTLRLGEGTGNNKVREDFEQPSFEFLANPPIGTKSAGSIDGDHIMYLAMKHAPGQGISLLRPISKLWGGPGMQLTPEETQLAKDIAVAYNKAVADNPSPKGGFDAAGPGLANQEAAIVAAIAQVIEAQKKRNSFSSSVFRGPALTEDIYRHMGYPIPKSAGVAWRVGQGHAAWNDLQGTVVEGMHKDAEFQQALAGAIAALKHATLDFDKTADGSPIIQYMTKFGGPRAVHAFMRSVQNPKYANALLSFYPDIKSFQVTSFVPELAPKQAAAKVTVVSERTDGMTDTERKRLIRDGFSVIDRREDTEKSQLFDTEFEKKYSNPTESGTYDMLLPTGAVARAWIMQPTSGATSKGLLCVETENKFFFTADSSCVFVRGDAVDAQGPYAAGKSLNGMEVGRRYALVDEKGNATAPFKVNAITAESGERVRINVSFDTYLDYTSGRNNTWGVTGAETEYMKAPEYLQLADFNGKSLTRSGANLIVPSNWKALALVSRYEYADQVCAEPQSADASTPELSARNAYNAFAPGNLTDLGEALHKSGVYHFAVATDDGSDYHIQLEDFREGPMTPRVTMTRLVTKYGMAPDDAENCMLDAQHNFKSRHLLKLGQFVGVGMPMPQDPGLGSEDISGMGLSMTEPYTSLEQGQLLGVPALQDSTRPGFALGGQSATEQLGGDAVMLANQAAQSGQKNVFDHATIGGLAHMYDSSAAIDMYLPELTKSLDRIGRILFIFYWKNDDFSERYGSEDLSEMEDLIRAVFKSFGDLVLKLKQKAVMAEDSRDILSI